MNHKCPNCDESISLYWLLFKTGTKEYKCKRCHSIIRRTSRYKIIGGVVGGLSGAGSVLIGFTAMKQYDSYQIAITAILVFAAILFLVFLYLVPCLIRIVPKEKDL